MSFQENVIPFLKRPNDHRTVLIVDDDRIQSMALDQQVKDMGYRTVLAGDGHEALEILGSAGNDIDIILMDRMMPVMDGLTAIMHIK